MTIRVTHRICSQTHRLTMTRDEEIHLQSTIDRILDLHLRFGKRNLNEESPKSECANHSRVNQTGGRVVHGKKRTRRGHYTRKSPYLGPSVL